MPRRRRRVDQPPADDPARALIEAFAAQMDILERHLDRIYEESYLETRERVGQVRVTSVTVEYRRGSEDVALELGTQSPASEAVVGLHRGVVVDTGDPRELGRLLVRIPSVLGEEPRWALPALPASAGGAPVVGDSVWVLFEAGSAESPVWLGRIP